jgi:hypothetical protein
MLGSTTDAVVAHPPCSVLVVRAHDTTSTLSLPTVIARRR